MYSVENVAKGELPPPLKTGLTDFNIIHVGAGSSGSYSAFSLARTGKLKVLVLDDGGPIGQPIEASFRPGADKSIFAKVAIDGSSGPGTKEITTKIDNQIKKILRGGAMRKSQLAMGAGPPAIAKREMYEPLGKPDEWSPEYIWGTIMDNTLNLQGPQMSKRHQNKGRIYSLESKNSPFQDAWISDAQAETKLPVNLDLNLLESGSNTIGAEACNVRPFSPPDNIPSTTENEYLLPELETNPNLVLVRNCQVTRILFDTSNKKPRAVGVEGYFDETPFTLRFNSGVNDYQEIICSLGAIYNPHVLILSGIGPELILKQFNIPPVLINNNVGYHLKDISASHIVYRIGASRSDVGFDVEAEWFKSPGMQSRPAMFTEIDGSEMYLLATPLEINNQRMMYGISFELSQPKEGNIIIKNLEEDPVIDYGWDNSTLHRHVEAFKLHRRIVNRKGEFSRRFSPVEVTPGPSSSVEEDELNLLVTAKKFIHPVNHYAGTTRMSKTPEDGVVGTDFEVFGVKGLRLSSLSVLRFAPGAGGQFWSLVVAWNLVNSIRKEINLPPLN